MKATNARAYAEPFITIDLPLRRDGEWRVVAVGDGQVSDLHRRQPREAKGLVHIAVIRDHSSAVSLFSCRAYY